MGTVVTSQLVADTHCHVYPSYCAGVFFAQAWRNLYNQAGLQKGPASPFLPALFLAERSDCHFFADLAAGRQNDPAYRVEATAEKEALRIILLCEGDPDRSLYLFAGRQIRTSERLEVLSLLSLAEIPDSLSLQETCAQVRASGGLPVITWAAGKWLGQRAELVRDYLAKTPADHFYLGDSSLRCAGMPGGRIFAAGVQKGLSILAGSDPLPFAGEEKRAGTYGISGPLRFEPERPATSVRRFLTSGRWQIIGRRNSLLTAGWRLMREKIS